MSAFKQCLAIIALSSQVSLSIAASDFDAEIKKTCLSTYFSVRPAWDKPINDLVASIRERIANAREKGKTIIYISLPLSAHRGGITAFNENLGWLMKMELLQIHGSNNVEIILPGQEETKLTKVSDLPPLGGEYLYMWTKVLAGEHCTGDVDWVYFMDRDDAHQLLELPEKSKRKTLEKILENLALHQPGIYQETASKPELKKAFLDYYLKHYSILNSKGARDEWNLIQQLSKKNPGKKIRQHFAKKWSTKIKRSVPKGYECIEANSMQSLQNQPIKKNGANDL